jgi:hypothetical protein
MANTTIPSELIADGSVVTAKIANDAVDADKLASDAVVTASIADDAVTLAKMAANSVDSDQYVDGSIDTIHIADGAITSAKLDTNIAVGGTLNVSGAFTSLGIDDNANATAITIDSDENVLVGKSVANTSVVGVEARENGLLVATRDGGQPLLIDRLTDDGDLVLFRKDSTVVGSIGVLSNRLYAGTGDTGLFFSNTTNGIHPWNTTSNSARDAGIDLGESSRRFKDLYLSGAANIGSVVQTTSSTGLAGNFENTNISGYGLRVTTYSTGVEYGLAVDSYGGGYSRDFTVGVDGNVNVLTGNLVIGTAGKGIDFSATSGTGTSELLDDYEEGTWTPVTNSGSWNIGFATYTKIGNMVTCRFQVVATSTIAANDFTGLPFTPAEFSAGVCGYQNSESAITYGILVQTPSVWNFRHGSTQKGVTNAAQVFGMFSYRTTA